MDTVCCRSTLFAQMSVSGLGKVLDFDLCIFSVMMYVYFVVTLESCYTMVLDIRGFKK